MYYSYLMQYSCCQPQIWLQPKYLCYLRVSPASECSGKLNFLKLRLFSHHGYIAVIHKNELNRSLDQVKSLCHLVFNIFLQGVLYSGMDVDPHSLFRIGIFRKFQNWSCLLKQMFIKFIEFFEISTGTGYKLLISFLSTCIPVTVSWYCPFPVCDLDSDP